MLKPNDKHFAHEFAQPKQKLWVKVQNNKAAPQNKRLTTLNESDVMLVGEEV